MEHKLNTIDFSGIKLFNFSEGLYDIKVVDIYDGDTLTVGLLYNDAPIKLKVRMEGYDSPEMKPSMSIENRDLNIKCAHLAKDKLNELTKDKILQIKFNETIDKYGRQLGKLYDNEICINDIMINEGYGKSYSGNKKSPYTFDELNIIMNK